MRIETSGSGRTGGAPNECDPKCSTPWHPFRGSSSRPRLQNTVCFCGSLLLHYPRLVPRDEDCAAKLKKRTLTNLYNEQPAWLDLAHRKLDQAVAAAYGWPVQQAQGGPTDLTDEQILERLLALNLERAEAERRAGTTTKRSNRAKRDDEFL